MHKMYFYWDSQLGDFFIPGLTINTNGSLVILCFIMALFSIVYEAMKVYQAKAKARAARERQRSASCAPSETANLIANESARTQIRCSTRFKKLLNEAIFFLIHTSLGYFLMLSVMLYNGFLAITIILAMGLGYFLFGHISMKVNMENVQARTTRVICTPKCADTDASSSSGNTSSGGSTRFNNQVGPTALERIQNFDQMTPSSSRNTTDSMRL